MVERQAQAPDSILDDAVRMMTPAAGSGIAIRSETAFDSPAPLMSAVPTAISPQVLSNLVTNATKAMASDGLIQLRAETRGAEILSLRMDNGPGIPEDELPLVFERYRRGKRVNYEGLGLGLTISRGIVEAHGGRIWAENAPGRGATFFFTVPRIAGTDALRGDTSEQRVPAERPDPRLTRRLREGECGMTLCEERRYLRGAPMGKQLIAISTATILSLAGAARTGAADVLVQYASPQTPGPAAGDKAAAADAASGDGRPVCRWRGHPRRREERPASNT